ncbi:MAG: glutaredoxin 3 [Pseudomonadota bacterium]
MAEVVMYSTMFCPFCMRAKALLKDKGVDFEEIDVMFDSAKRAEMTERSGGGRTVPQIFIDGEPIGGFDELNALDKEGRLDGLLGIAA